MNCRILATPDFARELKRLKKRYPSLKEDYECFLTELKANPYMGVALGKDFRKVRFSIKSKGKGKSGGARVITHVVVKIEEANITLVTIYDKSSQETISEKELLFLIKKNGLL